MTGQSFIELVESQGLFCIGLDPRREWYRYHHLFKDVLRAGLEERYDREEISEYAWAAAWFESRGLLEEAMHHLREGEDPAAAGRLMTRHRHQIMNREH